MKLVENLGTGFGFLTFESEESVDRCCSEHYVNINGKQVLNNKQTKKTPSLLYVKKRNVVPSRQIWAPTL